MTSHICRFASLEEIFLQCDRVFSELLSETLSQCGFFCLLLFGAYTEELKSGQQQQGSSQRLGMTWSFFFFPHNFSFFNRKENVCMLWQADSSIRRSRRRGEWRILPAQGMRAKRGQHRQVVADWLAAVSLKVLSHQNCQGETGKKV